MCFTVCHLAQVLFVDESSVSFVRRTSYEWGAPIRFYSTLYLWQIVTCYSPHFRHVPSCCLWFRCKSHPTALHSFVCLTSTVYWFTLSHTATYSLTSARKWNIRWLRLITRLSRSIPGNFLFFLMWHVGSNLTVLHRFCLNLISHLSERTCGIGFTNCFHEIIV